jgi:ankyrin repeat protein
MVKLLISWGADVHKQSMRGRSPLSYAVLRGNIDVIALISTDDREAKGDQNFQ